MDGVSGSTKVRDHSYPDIFCKGADCRFVHHRNRLNLGGVQYCGKRSSSVTAQRVVSIDYDRRQDDHIKIVYSLDCGCQWERKEFSEGVLAAYSSTCDDNSRSWELADATPAERKAMDKFQEELSAFLKAHS